MSDLRQDDLFVLLANQVEADIQQFAEPDEQMPRQAHHANFSREPVLKVRVVLLTKSQKLVGDMIGSVAYLRSISQRTSEGGQYAAYATYAKRAVTAEARKAWNHRNNVIAYLENARIYADDPDPLNWLRENLPPAVHLRVSGGADAHTWKVALDEIDNWSLISAEMSSP